MTYLNGTVGANDDLPMTMEHAVTQGLHDAMADSVKLAVLGSAITVAVLVILGPTGVQRLLKRLTGV